MTTIGDEVNELLQELDLAYNLPLLEDDDVTIHVIAMRCNIGERTARDRMKKMVEAGTVRKVYKRDSRGNRIATYIKI